MTFRSGTGDRAAACAAWWWAPPAPGAPVVVLGIGLGSVREMGLQGYGEDFARAGYAVLAFDHRSFGASGGEPRQVIDVAAQLEDWRAAIAFARTQEGVDPDRVVAWGTSFGGGHVLRLAGEGVPGLAAAVAQCPFSDGLASGLTLPPTSAVKVGVRAVRDLLAARRGRPPVTVATAGRPGEAALMATPDALDGFLGLVPPGTPTFRNEVAARIGLRILGYRPGLALRRARVPVWVGICDRDTVAPARRTARLVERAVTAEAHHYDAGHFEIYHDPWRARLVADQLAFLAREVPPLAS